jgi:integrase
MGCIYQRGGIYWIKYYSKGRPYQESTRSDSESEAKRLLKLREGEIAEGKKPGVCFERVKFDEIAEDYLTDFRINRKRSIKKAEGYVKKLNENFEGVRVVGITTASVKEYIQKRLEEGKANATVNRDLSALKRMFNLARLSKKVNDVPYIPMLKELNVRKGFFEHEQYLTLKDTLFDYLKPVATFAYFTGWRRGEILGLTWDRVDIKQGILRLEPGETKNDEARTLYMTPELWSEMKALHSKRRLGCPFVFHHDGEPIRRFEKGWRAACKKAGLKGKIFHDFRRTAARNMVRSGISERVVMTITGHKTRIIFDRYNIVSDQDLKEAAKKQQVYMESLGQAETVTKTVTVANLSNLPR